MLKQLRHPKKQRRRLLRGKALSDIQEEHDPRQEGTTFPWGDGRLVEDAGFLDDGGFVVVEGWAVEQRKVGMGTRRVGR